MTPSDEISKIGEPGATGAAAALGILREAVASANQVLTDHDTLFVSRDRPRRRRRARPDRHPRPRRPPTRITFPWLRRFDA